MYWWSGNILGKGYLAGFGMTIGTVFGRIAGAQAAGDGCTAHVTNLLEANRCGQVTGAAVQIRRTPDTYIAPSMMHTSLGAEYRRPHGVGRSNSCRIIA